MAGQHWLTLDAGHGAGQPDRAREDPDLQVAGGEEPQGGVGRQVSGKATWPGIVGREPERHERGI